MRIMTSRPVTALVFLSLAACGGGGGSGGDSGGGNGLGTVFNYAPSFADTPTVTVSQAIDGAGATGIALQHDPFSGELRFQNIRVRRSADDTTIYLSINGGAEIELEGGPPIYSDGRLIFSFGIFETDDAQSISSSGQVAGLTGFQSGFVGVETPVANLPSGTTTYRGSYSGSANSLESLNGDALLGQIALDVAFGTGDVSGTMAFGLTPVATIEGSVSGNGTIGNLILDDAYEYSGTVPIIGKTFGHDADTLAGVFGSNTVINTTTQEQTLFEGTFDTERQPAP